MTIELEKWKGVIPINGSKNVCLFGEQYYFKKDKWNKGESKTTFTKIFNKNIKRRNQNASKQQNNKH